MGNNYRDEIAKIKAQMYRGEITYAEAKELAQPIIDDINQRGKAIAKKHGRRYSKVGFAGIIR